MNSEEQRESHAQSKRHMKCTRKFIQAANGTKEVMHGHQKFSDMFPEMKVMPWGFVCFCCFNEVEEDRVCDNCGSRRRLQGSIVSVVTHQ